MSEMMGILRNPNIIIIGGGFLFLLFLLLLLVLLAVLFCQSSGLNINDLSGNP